MRKRLLFWVTFAVAVVASMISLSPRGDVYAEVMSADSLYKMSIMRGVRQCYKLYAKDEVKLQDFSGYTSIFNTGGKWGKTQSNDVWITTHVGNALDSSDYNDSNLSCEQVFNGYKDSAKGFKNYYAFPTKLEDYGYKFDHNEGGAGGNSGTANADSDQITITLDSITDASGNNAGNKISTSGSIVCDGKQKQNSKFLFIGNENYYWEVQDCSGKIEAVYDKDGKVVLSVEASGTEIMYVLSDYGLPSSTLDMRDELTIDLINLNDNANRLSFKDAFVGSAFDEDLVYDFRLAAFQVYGDPAVKISYAITTPKDTDEGNKNSIYVPISSKATAANIMLYGVGFDENLPHVGETEVDGYKYKNYSWSNYAKYSLYYRYLVNMTKRYPDININTCSAEKPESGYAFKNAPDEWCRVNIPTSAESVLGDTVSVVSGVDLVEGTFKDVLEWLGDESSYSGLTDEQYVNGATGDDGELDPGAGLPDDNIPPDPEATCGNSGGAGSLGWIVCPILDWMGNAAGETYMDYLEPNLKVEPMLFDESRNAGTKQGWDIFQGIANGLFIIMLLVVIFSQLTGLGIDNYGIKKILPKLIIAVILVNVSYYICVICIDLSNILGNSLQSLFNGLPTNVSSNVIAEIGHGSAAGSTLLSVGLLSAMTVGAAWVVWTNPAILLSLLVGALGVLISILFLFILLSGREAAIVVLTVISPLAFVCYMLPNTKNLFSKWVKIGQGLLLVYPIAGLLVGGGNYVSKLLMSNGAASEGFVPALTAMLVGIVPIFFIPTVLKGAFAALGSLGARISGVGDRLRNSTTSGIRNSDRYKSAQERGIERRTRINAGYDKNGNKRRDLNAFQRFMRGGRRGMQINSLRYQKMVSDRGSLEATEGEDFMLQAETANEMKRLVASGEINNTATLSAGLTNALLSGNRAQIRAYTDALTAKGEDGRKAVKNSYDGAVGTGRVSAASARTFADNIMANHAADYKNNHRSMFAVAQGINTGSLATAPTVSSYMGSVANQAALANKVTSTTIGNMDDDAFDEVFGGYTRSATSTIPTGASAMEIGAAAYAALNDQNANIKADRRRHLQEIVVASGYTPAVQNVNVAGGTVDANITNPVLDVQGTVNVGNEVDVNIRQSRGGQVQPVDVRPRIFPKK